MQKHKTACGQEHNTAQNTCNPSAEANEASSSALAKEGAGVQSACSHADSCQIARIGAQTRSAAHTEERCLHSADEGAGGETVSADRAPHQAKRRSARKEQLVQMLKFTGFSVSAGVIQLVSDGILCDWTGWLPWWPAYLISVLLSVIWNFTFNRKFTFRAANNVPVAMGLVVVYYCAFIPLSVFGGDAIAARLPANFGLLVTFLMMVVNFVTEFIWDKFVVFNDRVTQKIVHFFVGRGNQADRSEQALSQELPACADEQTDENMKR